MEETKKEQYIEKFKNLIERLAAILKEERDRAQDIVREFDKLKDEMEGTNLNPLNIVYFGLIEANIDEETKDYIEIMMRNIIHLDEKDRMKIDKFATKYERK